MELPPELSPYLSSNAPLPHELKPILEAYLARASSSIAELDAELDRLESERTLDAKREKRDCHQETYKKLSQLLSPIRSVPPEIWALIFGFTLGKGPFGQWEHRNYGHLREVCTTWRDVVATTPDLCRGLVIYLDGLMAETWYSNENGVQLPKDIVKSWLGIVSRNHPYHLVLGVEDEDAFDWGDDSIIDVLQWVLTTTPTPTTLSISTSGILSLVYANAPWENQISRLTLDFRQIVDRDTRDKTTFQQAFPCLKSLCVNAPVQFLSQMGHSNLQSLTLTQIRAPADRFSAFLLDFPALRELRIHDNEPWYFGINGSSSPLIHPTLEILVAEGQSDLVPLLEHITFPSLKFLGLNSWGLKEEHVFLSELIPAFFQRCSLDNKNFTVSIRGWISNFIFDLLLHNLPHGTRLHVDVDLKLNHDEAQDPPISSRGFTEIFASQILDDFDWLYNDQCDGSLGSQLVKLYMPQGALMEEEIEVHQEDLRDWGYELEILPVDSYRKLLRSSIPEITVDWEL
ncbi:hypothetical protein BKA70DRAFT_1272408 [Coprinopsis sp. MPI-PUGE-AT-0042]|nr:hypothetical protein BKA70DRAFT_1272408 [Coprinopsis sp. MPI-PUGE-AT-0042]